MTDRKKKIFVILGKSNTGKSTIFKEVMKIIEKKGSDVDILKSCTTRPKRENLIEDEYDFVTEKMFKELKDKNGLLEYNSYNTVHGEWFYFTRKEDLKEKNYIKIINPSGLKQLKESVKDTDYEVISLEIKADDFVIMERAKRREDGTGIKEITRRLEVDRIDFVDVESDFQMWNNGNETPQIIANRIYSIIEYFKDK